MGVVHVVTPQADIDVPQAVGENNMFSRTWPQPIGKSTIAIEG